MKLTWKGNWRKGEVVIEAESSDELISALNKLELIEPAGPLSMSDRPLGEGEASSKIPKISGDLGPSQAIREILNTQWGRMETRTMKEINSVLEANAIYFSASSLSGVLTNLVKKGELRRSKKDDQWAYALSTET